MHNELWTSKPCQRNWLCKNYEHFGVYLTVAKLEVPETILAFVSLKLGRWNPDGNGPPSTCQLPNKAPPSPALWSRGFGRWERNLTFHSAIWVSFPSICLTNESEWERYRQRQPLLSIHFLSPLFFMSIFCFVLSDTRFNFLTISIL